MLLFIAIGVGTFVAGYYFASYRQVGYKTGFIDGYGTATRELYSLNSSPDRWIVVDQKQGLALVNGSEIKFLWRETNDSPPQVVEFKVIDWQTGNSTQLSRGLVEVGGTLMLMQDPLSIPTHISDIFGIAPRQYYVFESLQGERYLLIKDDQ